MTKRFRIMIEVDATLDLNALWPDGDAPESPTEADVWELIKRDGGPARIIRDWNLEDDLYLSVRKLAEEPRR